MSNACLLSNGYFILEENEIIIMILYTFIKIYKWLPFGRKRKKAAEGKAGDSPCIDVCVCGTTKQKRWQGYL